MTVFLSTSWSQTGQHSIHHVAQFISRSVLPIFRDPSIKIFSFHQELPFDPMMGQGMDAIKQAISKPADGAGGVDRESFQVEVSWIRG
jgi:hypothetical protein